MVMKVVVGIAVAMVVTVVVAMVVMDWQQYSRGWCRWW